MAQERNNATPGENWAFNAAIKIEKEKSKQEIINKACDWLEREYAYNGSMSVLNNELIEAFRKAMEE